MSKVMWTVLAVTVVVMAVKSVPDLARYVKMRKL